MQMINWKRFPYGLRLISPNQFTLFHRPRDNHNLPLYFSNLKVKIFVNKLLGVMVDANFSWVNHTTIVENKLSKNLGLLYKAKAAKTKNSW